MKDIIQITEEQARDMLEIARSYMQTDNVMNDWKKEGYIKQSALEKAKENYYESNDSYDVADKYIHELEKALEEK